MVQRRRAPSPTRATWARFTTASRRVSPTSTPRPAPRASEGAPSTSAARASRTSSDDPLRVRLELSAGVRDVSRGGAERQSVDAAEVNELRALVRLSGVRRLRGLVRSLAVFGLARLRLRRRRGGGSVVHGQSLACGRTTRLRSGAVVSGPPGLVGASGASPVDSSPLRLKTRG